MDFERHWKRVVEAAPVGVALRVIVANRSGDHYVLPYPCSLTAGYPIHPNRIELDQFVFRIERLPDTTQKDHVDWGFNVTNLYGLDYRYTIMKGIFSDQLLAKNRTYGYDIPTFYGDSSRERPRRKLEPSRRQRHWRDLAVWRTGGKAGRPFARPGARGDVDRLSRQPHAIRSPSGMCGMRSMRPKSSARRLRSSMRAAKSTRPLAFLWRCAPLIGSFMLKPYRKRKDSTYRSGRSPDWIKMKNPNAPAVKREAEEDWGR